MFYDFIKGYKSPVEKKHRHFFDDSFYNHDDCVNTSILDFLRNALIPETLIQDNTGCGVSNDTPLLHSFVVKRVSILLPYPVVHSNSSNNAPTHELSGNSPLI